MLREIKLQNFKCFEELNLPCASLNLLCGLNGMGKSSVIQALLVLRQSSETGELQNGRLVLGGERVDLGAGSDVLFEDADRDVLGFSLTSNDIENSWDQDFDCPNTAELLDVSHQEVQARPQGADILEEHPELASRAYYDDLVGSSSHLGMTYERFLAIIERLAARPTDLIPDEWVDQPPFGGQLVYVDAERTGPRKFYPLSDVLARRGDFGPSGEYALNYLNRHQDDLLDMDDPRSANGNTRRLADVVDQWMQEVCPGAHLHLQAVPDADALLAGFIFDRQGDIASRRYRATNVGFGLSYVLPVILALLSEPGTLCLIENPEAHIHPRGQTKLAELTALASRAGVQVFAETHSDHFMDGIRIAVREELVEPKDIMFHYFGREGNKTVITTPEIDVEGRLSRWPAGFFGQHEENLARLLAPRKLT